MIATGNNAALEELFKTSSNIKSHAGCTIEYNINSMVNDPVVNVGAATQSVETTPFKKLFPVDTIVKANRPIGAGVRYYIIGDIVSGDWANPKLPVYPPNTRLYIPGADLTYKYYVSPKGDGFRTDSVSVSYPKKVFVNKITAKFEISHSEPASFSIYATPYGGSETLLKSGNGTNIKDFSTTKTYDEGVVSIYYTGSGWSFSESDLNTSAHIELSSVKLSFVAASNEYVGVIELAPKYVIDVTDDIVNFSINKESTADVKDSLPVGYVNSNTLQLDLSTYNKSALRVKSYDKESSSFESNIIYFYKMAEVKPYLKVYHPGGLKGTSEKYDIVPQGTFYMDSSKITEYGDFTINGLDGAKILQEILPQDALCESYSVTAILRRMLDNVGFTNYNFNLNGTSESSIMTPLYWWTDDTKTVWEHIQELCRDSQMTAVFDENNILQFYSRDYLYNQSQTKWTMHRDKSGNTLPDIIDFEKEDLPSANKIKILWYTPQKASALDANTSIWESPTSFLSAYGLAKDILSTDVAGSYMQLVPSITADYQYQMTMNTFAGFLLIDAEIIEFDAVQYAYKPAAGGNLVTVDITSQSDLLKYNAFTDYNIGSIQPTGKYRIKTRGAYGTNGNVSHTASSESVKAAWTTGGTEFNSAFELYPSKNSKVITKSVTNTTKIDSKTLYTITNISKTPNHYEIAYKPFNSVTAQSGTAQYYSFGNTFSLGIDPASGNTEACGGMAFFVNSVGTSMYYVRVRSTYLSNQTDDKKDIVIYKVLNGTLKELMAPAYTNIYGGVSLKMDITVKTTSTKNTINVFLNGVKFSVDDIFSPTNFAVPFSNNIGMISQKNSLSFDYVYGLDITEKAYNQNTIFTPYAGQYSDMLLKFVFGQKVLDVSGMGTIDKAVEDFGSVAREIKFDSMRFSTRPAYPQVPSLGINQFASILGYDMSPFGASIYLINNSGSWVPLSDGDKASYFVAGKTLAKSSQLEYTNYTNNEYTVQEPVIFESNWIQTEPDVKKLSDWIKTQWAKKQYVITMNIFGNPLLSVGDVIEIDYPYQGMEAGKKFLISAINQSYDGGLTTNITCRTL